jgi:hypothetical protein
LIRWGCVVDGGRMVIRTPETKEEKSGVRIINAVMSLTCCLFLYFAGENAYMISTTVANYDSEAVSSVVSTVFSVRVTPKLELMGSGNFVEFVTSDTPPKIVREISIWREKTRNLFRVTGVLD